MNTARLILENIYSYLFNSDSLVGPHTPGIYAGRLFSVYCKIRDTE